MDMAPDYALYSPKIVKAGGNKGQPVFLVNNFPYAVSNYPKNSIQYVSALATDHPLKTQAWYKPAWYSTSPDGLEGAAFPETYSVLDLFVTPTACLHRLCTCAQLHESLAGGMGATQTPAQTYFAFFATLQSDINAKALLQKARVADPFLFLFIRGQNLGPSCTLDGQSIGQKSTALKLTYSMQSARVQYALQSIP